MIRRIIEEKKIEESSKTRQLIIQINPNGKLEAIEDDVAIATNSSQSTDLIYDVIKKFAIEKINIK